MKRRFPGLSQAALPASEVPDGLYLVRVERMQYRWDKQPKALWKLAWFLRDFGYDTELLGRDELEEKRLLGLEGVVKVSQTTVNGRTYVNLDAFAPAGEWDEFSIVGPSAESAGAEPEVA